VLSHKYSTQCNGLFQSCENKCKKHLYNAIVRKHSRRIGSAHFRILDLDVVPNLEEEITRANKLRFLTISQFEDEIARIIPNSQLEQVFFVQVENQDEEARLLNSVDYQNGGEILPQTDSRTMIEDSKTELGGSYLPDNECSNGNESATDVIPTRLFGEKNSIALQQSDPVRTVEALGDVTNASFRETLGTQTVKPYKDSDGVLQKEQMDLFDCAEDGNLKDFQQHVEANSQHLLTFHPRHGGTLLHAACFYGHFEIVQYLLDLGYPVNIRAKNGSSPLHWAAGAGLADICELLLRHGADPRMRTVTWSRNVFGRGSGQTPYHWAAESNHESVLRVLVGHDPVGAVLEDERQRKPVDIARQEMKPVAEFLSSLQSRRVVGIRVSNPFTKRFTKEINADDHWDN